MREILVNLLSFLTVCGGWLFAIVFLIMWAEMRKRYIECRGFYRSLYEEKCKLKLDLEKEKRRFKWFK